MKLTKLTLEPNMIRSTSHTTINNSCLESRDNSGLNTFCALFASTNDGSDMDKQREENILCKVTLDYSDQLIMCIHHFDFLI